MILGYHYARHCAARAAWRAGTYAWLTCRSRATGSRRSGPGVVASVFLCRNLQSTYRLLVNAR